MRERYSARLADVEASGGVERPGRESGKEAAGGEWFTCASQARAGVGVFLRVEWERLLGGRERVENVEGDWREEE